MSTIEPILAFVDYVLVMTVNPGFGGQVFIERCLDKVRTLAQLKATQQLDFDIEVDGGINADTVAQALDAGATMLVTGSYFFHQPDYRQATQQLKG